MHWYCILILFSTVLVTSFAGSVRQFTITLRMVTAPQDTDDAENNKGEDISMYDDNYEEEHKAYAFDGNGVRHPLEAEIDEQALSVEYDPEKHNVYYLYTRQNRHTPYSINAFDSVSLVNSNFNPNRNTIVLVHGWNNDFKDPFSKNLPQAILEAADVNTLVVDWSIGAETLWYFGALDSCVKSGPSVAKFLNWICKTTGADQSLFHLIGHSLGAQQVGIIGRNMDVRPAYITACDPAQPGWERNSNILRPEDANYTEVIHSNAGLAGCKKPLGHVDFYPNGGRMMPGCFASIVCSHSKSYEYLAESITGGYFEGYKCKKPYRKKCPKSSKDHLRMGGLTPKPGFRGSYYLETNPESPYAKQFNQYSGNS